MTYTDRCWLLTLPLLLTGGLSAAGDDELSSIPEIVVTSLRRGQDTMQHAGNIDRLGTAAIERASPHHAHELLTRVPGTWVSRGSGQEHLTAIRSPVLTGAGSCGAFLLLEDGIPIRPAGFCNVNGLFELGLSQAHAVEVIRGPANALYGSNALHGTINALMPEPAVGRAPLLAVEAGANRFIRARAELPLDSQAPWLAAIEHTDDGGFRRESGYRQSKLHIKHRWLRGNGDVTVGFSATDLDQDTAGFIVGKDAYKDPLQRTSNPNPEAFRNASSQRLYARWTHDAPHLDLDIRPFVRHSHMRFLQHFLPGKPLEENGHLSGGVIATANVSGDSHATTFGFDLEWADLFLKQSQAQPTPGSPFLTETRPAGQHYDFDVQSLGAAAYIQSGIELTAASTLGLGLRVERLRYRYDNRMLAGNTRDDGSECGFGGCLYSRPADRSDGFTNIAPKLSFIYRVNSSAAWFVNLARGFRAPQATELYRLQSGQQVADLRSERLDSLELGLRLLKRGWSGELALHASRKRNSIYRDAEGFNVSAARSTHRGIEVDIRVTLAPAWSLLLNASHALHQYDFNTVAARGETVLDGRDVDTAPRLLGSVEIVYDNANRVDAALQLATVGRYFLDAENRFRYPGHSVANLRAGIGLTRRLSLMLRLNNVTDRALADRADHAFGDYRYFPGRGREFFAELRYSPETVNESL
jgi:outer membrane receptor protein involved in Fe transport